MWTRNGKISVCGWVYADKFTESMFVGDEVETDLMPNVRVMGDVHTETKIRAEVSDNEWLEDKILSLDL